MRHRRLGLRASAVAAALACAAGCAGASRQAPPAAAVLAVKGRLAADAVWQGTVVIEDDVQVPVGRTLRILAGTRVRVRPADSAKTEPEYLDNATEILVRGRLIVEGTEERPVSFEPLEGAAPPEDPTASPWAGIILDGGAAEVRHARVSGAETGFTLLAASPALSDVLVERARTGIAVHAGSAPRLARVRILARETGIFCWPGSSAELDAVDASGAEHEGLLVAPGGAPRVSGSHFAGGVADVLWGATGDPPVGLGAARVRRVAAAEPAAAAVPPPPFAPRVPEPGGPPTRTYRGESFIGEDTTWEGEILIDGTVMVSPVARLTVAPGTVVRFVFRDTDGDGLGESELFVQGTIDARGTAERPIVFAAREGHAPGRWGAINLMGGDEAESTLSWCLVQDGYRGLHGHFARFRVEHCVFRGNYRSLQFQESKAAIADCAVSGSASGLRFRDSTAAIERLTVTGCGSGLQVFRSTFSLAGSTVAGNALAGMHVRESEGTVAGCTFAGNSPGVRTSDSRLRIAGNRFLLNNGGGLLLRRTRAAVEGNRFEASRGNAISTDSPESRFRGNAVEGSLRFAVENNAAGAVDAVGNWWGPAGPARELFFDRRDDPRLGPVLVEPALDAPPPLP
jgi:hypothetical protein